MTIPVPTAQPTAARANTVPALELSSLSKSFGANRAVHDLELAIPQGQLYALLGPNGAGKTTTLRMVAGLLRPDQGDAYVLGRSILRDPSAAKRNLAFVPDEPLTGLDAAAARAIKDLLVDYVARGNCVVLTTHIMSIAEQLAERIGIIHHGRLIAEGSLEELRERSDSAGGTLESVFLELVQRA